MKASSVFYFFMSLLLVLSCGKIDMVWGQEATQVNPAKANAPLLKKDEENDDDDDDDDVSLAMKREMEKRMAEMTPFAKAAMERDYAKMKELFKNGASVDELFNKNFFRGAFRDLERALADDDRDDVLDAIDDMLEDINKPDFEGKLPLDYAIEAGRLDYVKLLVEHGADVNGPIDGDCEYTSPVACAVTCGNLEILKYLAENGADVSSPNSDAMEYLLDERQDRHDILRYILSKGYDVNIRFRTGDTALHFMDNAEGVGILLASGAKTDVLNSRKMTPMDCAIEKQNYGKVKKLLEHGVSHKGYSLLNLAAVNGDFELVKKLVEEGTDVNGYDWKYGKTVLYEMYEYAAEVDKAKLDEIAKYLLAKGADPRLGCTSHQLYSSTSRSALYAMAGHAGLKLLQDALKGIPPAQIQNVYARDLIAGAAHGGNMENMSFVLSLVDIGGIGRNILDDAMVAGVESGNLDMLRLLLSKGGVVNGRKRDWNCLSAVNRAIHLDRMDMLSFLLDNGASVKDMGAGEIRHPLFRATARLDVNAEAVRILLEHGAYIDVRGYAGETPLFLAIKHDGTESVKLLLAHGADAKLRTVGGLTTMHYAAQTGNVAVMSMLLKAGVSAFDDNNDHKEPPIVKAVEHRKLSACKFLLKQYHGEARRAILDRLLPLACINLHRGVLKFILEQCCAEDEKTAEVPETEAKAAVSKNMTLHEAVNAHELQKVRELVKNGADVNAVDNDGNTPLDIAFSLRHVLPWNQSDFNNLEIIHFLIEHGADTKKTKIAIPKLALWDPVIARYMVEKGADVNVNIVDKGMEGEMTPLWNAVQFYDVELAQKLLEAGADVNGLTNDKKSMLTYIASRNDGWHWRENGWRMAKCLLEHGADVNRGNPIVVAIKAKRYDLASLILDYSKSITDQNSHEDAMFEALAAGRLDIVGKLAKLCPETDATAKKTEYRLRRLAYEGNVIGMQRLIDATGVNVNNENEYHDTPLFFALEGGNLDAAMFLIDNGADVKAIGSGNETLLHCAARLDLGFVMLLVEKGLDVNAKNELGVTPLHHAVCRGRLDVAKYLLEHGVDINVVSTKGDPLFVCAAVHGTVDVLKFLVENGLDCNVKTSSGMTAMQVACAVNREIVPYLQTLGLPTPTEKEIEAARKRYSRWSEPEDIDCRHFFEHQDIEIRID